MIQQAKIKNILITGGSGFIGSHFLNYASYPHRLQRKVIAPTHRELDILNREQLRRTFDQLHPEIVINFAAHRNANTAELQRDNRNGSVWKTNVEGVENIYKISREYGSFLIHISTDMVFSGRKDNPGPYDERAKIETNLKKLSWYGWTKAEAERLLTNNKKAAIIRIGNVTQALYDPKLDYVGKILYLFDHDKLYPLFKDQYLTLTYTPSIFKVIEVLMNGKINGIFHISSKNVFTPYGLGEYLINKARKKRGVTKSVNIRDYLKEFPNRYPQYGGLFAEKTAYRLGIKLFNWKQIIDFYIKKTKSSSKE